MVSVYFFNCENVVKEYLNITLTPEIIAEITAWVVQAEIEESWVQIF